MIRVTIFYASYYQPFYVRPAYKMKFISYQPAPKQGPLVPPAALEHA